MANSFSYCRVCEHSLNFIKDIRGEETGKNVALFKCKNCSSYFSRTDFFQQTSSDISQASIDGHLNSENYVLDRVGDIFAYSINRCLLPETGTDFLDIGCGVGWSLIAAEKMGYKAVGIEPMDNAAAYANTSLNVKVLNSLFSAELFKGKKFDFIMMDQVLEHVPNPVETLVDAFSLLKPGGLFFLSVPPIDWSRIAISVSYWLSIKNMGIIERTSCLKRLTVLLKKYDTFCFPEGHINYFSTKAILILAERCNAKLIGQYHLNKSRAKYFPCLKLSTGSFLLKKR